MELIVVGTDGSETATRAVATAIEMAQQTGGKLAVVTAYTPAAGLHIRYAADSGEGTAWKDGLSESKVETVLAEAVSNARLAGVDAEIHVRKGDPADAILDVAEEQKADLIVVGNKGMSGARRFLLGSVPNKVTHHAPCNVLVVRTS